MTMRRGRSTRSEYRRSKYNFASHFSGSSTTSQRVSLYQLSSGAAGDGLDKYKNLWWQVHFSTSPKPDSNSSSRVQWGGFAGLVRWPESESMSASDVNFEMPRLLSAKPFVLSGWNNAILLEGFLKGVNLSNYDELNVVVALNEWPSGTNEELVFSGMVKYVRFED